MNFDFAYNFEVTGVKTFHHLGTLVFGKWYIPVKVVAFRLLESTVNFITEFIGGHNTDRGLLFLGHTV